MLVMRKLPTVFLKKRKEEQNSGLNDVFVMKPGEIVGVEEVEVEQVKEEEVVIKKFSEIIEDVTEDASLFLGRIILSCCWFCFS